MDTLSPEARSENMRRVGQKDTAPEMYVRRLAHRLGYRFRLHKADLPGKPDLVFPSLRKVVFVHGCFWHGHHCKEMPKSNVAYWKEKIARNKARDARTTRLLRRQGWKVMTVWQCGIQDAANLERRLRHFLSRF